jgi:hypothetical protein
MGSKKVQRMPIYTAPDFGRQQRRCRRKPLVSISRALFVESSSTRTAGLQAAASGPMKWSRPGERGWAAAP